MIDDLATDSIETCSDPMFSRLADNNGNSLKRGSPWKAEGVYRAFFFRGQAIPRRTKPASIRPLQVFRHSFRHRGNVSSDPLPEEVHFDSD